MTKRGGESIPIAEPDYWLHVYTDRVWVERRFHRGRVVLAPVGGGPEIRAYFAKDDPGTGGEVLRAPYWMKTSKPTREELAAMPRAGLFRRGRDHGGATDAAGQRAVGAGDDSRCVAPRVQGAAAEETREGASEAQGDRAMTAETTAQRTLRPLFDRCIVKELDADKMRKSGLVMPDTLRENDAPPQHGIVLAVGPGLDWWDSQNIEMPVAPGDHIVFPRAAGVWIEIDEERLLSLRVGEIVAVVEG